MSHDCYHRRKILKGALLGLSALSAAGLVRRAGADGAPHLDEKDPFAAAMGYVHDATTLDPGKTPQFRPGSDCANCLQLSGKEGETWRPCNIFPGKLVNAKGWCKVWVGKPGG